MSVWVTRSAPDNLATARRLRAAGMRPLLFPVIATTGLAARAVAARPDALVFSSVHAVRHHPLQTLDVPVFVRNEEIASAARGAGYASITSTGDDDDLLTALLDYAVPATGTISYFCAARTSPELERRLTRDRRRVHRHEVYTSQPVPPEQLQPLIDRLTGVSSIVLHSSIGSGVVRDAIDAIGWRGSLWCISERSARRFSGLCGVHAEVAHRPTESALLDMVCDSTSRREWRGTRRNHASDLLRPTRRSRPIANDNDREGSDV